MACPARYIFPHYFINGTSFENKILNLNLLFGFPLECFSETFLILRTTELGNVYRSPYAVPYRYSYHILKKFGFSQQILEKSYKITFRKNPSSGSRVVPCVRTDGQTDMMKLTFAFRKFANATRNGSPLLFFR